MKFLYAYRNIAWPANVVTVILCYALISSPSFAVFLYLVWCKIIVLAFLLAYIHFFRDAVLYFFMNLGIGKIRFYGSIVGIDLAISVFLFACILMIR